MSFTVIKGSVVTRDGELVVEETEEALTITLGTTRVEGAEHKIVNVFDKSILDALDNQEQSYEKLVVKCLFCGVIIEEIQGPHDKEFSYVECDECLSRREQQQGG